MHFVIIANEFGALFAVRLRYPAKCVSRDLYGDEFCPADKCSLWCV